ncbi:MAG: DUF4271 domain-containing protein [Muribaculaceae bacterium]|nr:DUF4271 domain-containing protein [Muribaculaceae bacterium]
MPFNRSNEYDAPTSPTDKVLYSTREPGWISGVKGELRDVTPGSDTGILAMVVLLLVLFGFNMRHIRRLFRAITQDLWSVRRRANAFDDHTANETRTIVILLFQLCVFEGILLYLWLGVTGQPGHSVFMPVIKLTGLASLFYIFELLACTTVGYVFTDHVNAVQWRRGLNASSVMLGIALTVPTLVSLFYPSVTGAMLWVAAIMYIMSRMIYVAKGFRIFYNNFPSLLYFILYLCTLEIIPLLAVYAAAMAICNPI